MGNMDPGGRQATFKCCQTDIEPEPHNLLYTMETWKEDRLHTKLKLTIHTDREKETQRKRERDKDNLHTRDREGGERRG